MAENKPRGEASDYYNTSLQPRPQSQSQGYPEPLPPAQNPTQWQAPPSYPTPLGKEDSPPTTDPNQFTFNQAFKVDKPKWNDLWAGVLLIAVFGGFVGVSGWVLTSYSNNRRVSGSGIYDGNNNFGLSTNTVLLFTFVLALSTVLSYVYVLLARYFPKAFIWVTGILNIVFGFTLAIYMFTRKSYGGAIVFLIFSIFTVICFISWIPRIPFSAFMLRTSIDVSKRYGHTYIVSFVGGLIGVAFAAWYSVTLVAIYNRYQPSPNNPQCSNGQCSKGTVIGLVAFITFAMYWISEWLKNTIHTTIAGVYGSWYYWAGNTAAAKGATRGALKRSLTYSFGSISLGSLVVAIINCIRHILSIAQSSAAQDGNIFAYMAFCVLSCIISIIDWVVEFINRYAFVNIALYGKPYFAAAKDTWTIIKQRGIDALINLCLIGPVLSLGAMFVGFASALLAFLYLAFTDPAYNKNGEFTSVVLAFSFLIGLQICNIFTTPLSSGIDTIFVASAWDPEVLQRDHPDIYNEMVRVYPAVATAIHA